MSEATAAVDDVVLDDVYIAHELRRVLWRRFGERAVPLLWVHPDGCGLNVVGADGYVYTVTIQQGATGHPRRPDAANSLPTTSDGCRTCHRPWTECEC